MANDRLENRSGGNRNLSGYVEQLFIVPVVAAILLIFFYAFFGFDPNLLQINTAILVIWLSLVLLSFLIRPNGELWREYRWIIAPAVLILLFLFDTSWAQSTLSTSVLQKGVIERVALHNGLQLNVEFPSRILYDGSSEAEARLWTIGSFGSRDSIPLKIESNNNELLFAIKTESEAPLQWARSVEMELSEEVRAVTLVVQPLRYTDLKPQRTTLNVFTGGTKLNTADWQPLSIESRWDAQLRAWKTNILGTSSIVVSLIVAIFAGVKQFEEEKKRRRADEIRQAIDTFDTAAKDELTKILKQTLELVRDWDEWDRTLQTRFSEKISTFFQSRDFCESLVEKSISDLPGDIDVCQQLSAITSIAPEQPRLIGSSLQHNAQDLLTLLKNYPHSLALVEKITRSFPPDLKTKIPDDYKSDFLPQILELKHELGFVDLDGFPLKSQFHFYLETAAPEDRLAVWLQKHELCYSPFIDAVTPHTLVPSEDKSGEEGKRFIDLVPTGFVLPALEQKTEEFILASSWDTSAALFEYVRNLPTKTKGEAFVVLMTPTMVSDFGTEQPRELFLHALAEQWLWALAETSAGYYSLRETQRPLLRRLLCWHGGSASAVVNSLEQILGERLDDRRTKNLFKKTGEWLATTDNSELRKEEINGLIELRPFPAQFTLLLISSADWWMQAGGQLSPDVHRGLDKNAEWLQMHGWALVHFVISKSKNEYQAISIQELEKQCRQRMLICSGGRMEAFEQLFAPHSKEAADHILARKASGSPGKMVRLGQALLLRHLVQHPQENWLRIEDLEALTD